MEYNYDTARIRREARQIEKIRKELAADCTPEIKDARVRLANEVCGSAADALDERLMALQKRVSRLDDDLMVIYNALMRYANKLEAIDAQLAQSMGGSR